MPRQQPSFLIVAHAAACGVPNAIGIEAGPAGRITPVGEVMTGQALQRALPGVDLRQGAAGARFGGYIPRNAIVHVRFDKADCPPARFTLSGGFIGRRVVDAAGIPPPGLSATPAGYIGNMTLKVTFALGPDGAPFAISVLNGDARYEEAAIEAVRKWRFESPLINGAPAYSPNTMTIDVVFR
jgi:TonB family protein